MVQPVEQVPDKICQEPDPVSPGQSQHQVYVSPHMVAVQFGLAQLATSPQQ